MANKETREIYRGKAIIMGIAAEGVEDWKDWEKRDLPQYDLANAIKIVYDVAEGNANGARHEVKLECSHRELKGEMLNYYSHEDGSTPTQMDVTIRSLVSQGLLPRGAKESDLHAAVAKSNIGRVVHIRAYEEMGKDGASWWQRCVFASARSLITGTDLAARISALISGKPAPERSSASAATAATATAPAAMPPAPEEDASVELPF